MQSIQINDTLPKIKWNKMYIKHGFSLSLKHQMQNIATYKRVVLN
jgi:hypothetical protein